MVKKRSQISIEYLLLTGVIVLVIIVPSAYFLFNTANNNVIGTLNNQKAVDLGNNIVQTAKQIYYLGLFSKNIVEIEVPKNLEEMFVMKIDDSIAESYYFGILVNDTKQLKKYFFQSDVPIVSDASLDYINLREDINISYVPECSNTGVSCDFYFFKDWVLKPGKKNIKIETKIGDFDTDAKVFIIPQNPEK